MSDGHYPGDLSRRDFVTIVSALVGTVMGAMIGIPLIGYFIGPAAKAKKEDKWIQAGPLKNYPKDKPTLFTFTITEQHGWEKAAESYGVYIIRESDTDITVLSNICTHLGCRVKWNEQVKEYICPCHNAHFTKEGKVISGPAPRPLDRYDYKVENGTLYIHYNVGGTKNG